MNEAYCRVRDADGSGAVYGSLGIGGRAGHAYTYTHSGRTGARHHQSGGGKSREVWRERNDDPSRREGNAGTDSERMLSEPARGVSEGRA